MSGIRALACALTLVLAVTAAAAAPQTIYDDAFVNGWQDWSWGTHDPAYTAIVHSGTHSISFVPKNWEAVYPALPGGASGNSYDGLEFWIHGGTAGGQDLRIVFVMGGTVLANDPLTKYLPGGPVAGTWSPVRVPLDDAGVGRQTFDGIYFQDGSGGTQPTVYLDDIVLTERTGGPDPGTPVAVSVDRGADRHAIDPRVYGVNYGEPTTPVGMPAYPVRRWGGNSTTRYNWRQDVSNRASDWFFMNIANATDVSRLPDDSTADRFLDDARAHGAEPLLTVPLIGWTPVDRVKRWGFSVAKYGAQQQTECTATGWPSWCEPDAGNGVLTSGANVTGNAPADTSIVIGPSFVTDWMAHVAGRIGDAAHGGLRWYDLDNEPALWNSTHRDVHPAPLDEAELWQRTVDYASAMKRRDRGALTFGPVAWGWCEYFYSAKDGCAPGTDYAANGPLLEWYLRGVEAYRREHGVRLVDYLDIHWYPQGNGIALSDDESPDTAARRLRSVKGLYDPAYVDESWIGVPVYLVPRMRDIIARTSPGTKLSITEYNWGNDGGLTSALAQVEVLALFGREGVDVATRWVAPGVNTRVEDAFRMYLDYDGAGSRVTGDSVRATSAAVDDVVAYAVRRPDDRLFVVLVNKATVAHVAQVSVTGGLAGDVALFGFDGAGRLAPKGSVSPSGGDISIDMTARSAILAVGQLAPCATPSAVTGFRVRRSGANLVFTWTDVPGAADYQVGEDGASDGIFTATTGTATSGTPGLTAPMPGGNRFYLVGARNTCGTGDRR